MESERAEIDNLLERSNWIVDHGQWDEWQSRFTEGADVQ